MTNQNKGKEGSDTESLCDECGEHAGYTWQTHSRLIRLCREHYEAMELDVHRKEKASRLLQMTTSVISGSNPNFQECPIGEHCPWCLKVGLRTEVKA